MRQPCWRLVFFLCAFALIPLSAQGAVLVGAKVDVATSDARVTLQSGAHGPLLLRLSRAHKAAAHTIELSNQTTEALPAQVNVDGVETPIEWNFDSKSSSADIRHVRFVYESINPKLRLTWEWQARAGFGALEHSIRVENLSTHEIWLPMIDSLLTAWALTPGSKWENFYVEKGADTPSPDGTHLESISDGYRWIGRSSTYARPSKDQPREIIPAVFVYDRDSQSGWYAGIEFSGRTRISLERNSDSLSAALGLNPEPGPFRTRVTPGDRFETPTVFLGAFDGGPDGAGNQLRPWIRQVLTNPITRKDPHYPLLVNNSWGSGMQVDEPLALRMIHESRELGLEMFHVDAGWFRGVGDWYADPKKFPHGLAYIADAAHQDGLRFGIWVDWTQAGLDTEPGALNARDPRVRDWLVADIGPDWKPEPFKGQTIDIGVPQAHAYAAKEVKRLIETNHLDMIEHDGYLVAYGCTRDDHPHAAPDKSTMHITHDWGSDFILASNSTDVSYHAVRAYYDIYAQARREHPGLLFEICNDGGRMVDFGSASHGDYFSITDTYDPISNRRAFYDASYELPPAMLEDYIEKWPTPRIENLLYMLRSGMMGWATIMLDTSAWTPEQHTAAKQAFALYKQQLRPLIRDARLYHISERPDGKRWDGMEYWDPGRGKGVVYAFRGSNPNDSSHRFRLAGLQQDRSYRLHFQDGSSADRLITGSELMANGLQINLKYPLSSELVFLSSSNPSH